MKGIQNSSELYQRKEGSKIMKVKTQIKEDSMLVEPTRIEKILNEEEYVNAVVNGDILLPVHDNGKMIAKVQWKGNLKCFSEETGGRGLTQHENQLILTELINGKATARIVTPDEAILWIVSSENYHLLFELNLDKKVRDLMNAEREIIEIS